MVDTQTNIRRFASDQWVALIFSVPWLEVAAELYKLIRKLWRGLADEGMYEVLEYESTLELLGCQCTRVSQVKHRLGRIALASAVPDMRASFSTPATYLRVELASLSPRAFSSIPERRRSDKWRPPM